MPGIAGTAAAQLGTLIARARDRLRHELRDDQHSAPLLPPVYAALGDRARLADRRWMLPPPPSTTDGWRYFGAVLAILILADIVAVIACIARAWRRGSRDARDFGARLGAADDRAGAHPGLPRFRHEPLWRRRAAGRAEDLGAANGVAGRISNAAPVADAFRAGCRAPCPRELDELARRDALTGLLNRRGFVDRATAILDAAAPATSPFGLLLIDIDHFKMINDRYGHDAGDAALQCIADRLRAWEGDLCFAGRLRRRRVSCSAYRGSEARCSSSSQRARARVSPRAPCATADQDEPVTASIGAASAAAKTDFKTLYKAVADMALYEPSAQAGTAW